MHHLLLWKIVLSILNSVEELSETFFKKVSKRSEDILSALFQTHILENNILVEISDVELGLTDL